MDINPRILEGPWKAGFALDLHTLSSVPLERTTKKVIEIVYINGQPTSVEKEVQEVTKWDTTYTPIGLEMNQLKYHGQDRSAEIIGGVAADFLMERMQSWNIDLIIPIPPSNLTRK